jgi:hypothetical protein
MRRIVQLARRGDIVNILPFAKWLSDQQGSPVQFYVYEEFADVLEPCSYVQPIITTGSCVSIGKRVPGSIVTQVDGNVPIAKKAANFTLESWLRAGAMDRYHELPLIFDRRNRDQEPRLLGNTQDNMLLCLEGYSSPFPQKEEFRQWVYRTLGSRYRISDIGNLHLAKSHHLLGLLDSASLLLTIDTLPLHLSYATNTPTIAMSADNPQYQSERRRHWIGRFTYGSVMDKLEEVRCLALKIPVVGNGKIHHTVDWFLPGGHDRIRVEAARKTWEQLGEEWVIHLHDSDKASRTSQSQLGDTRNMPFIKDLFEHGIKGLADDDIIVFTNADICILPNAPDQIRTKLALGDCCYSRRIDVKDCTKKPVGPMQTHVGADLFACKVSWWRAHRHELPDLIYSCEGWDFVARRIWKKHNQDAEIIPPVIYHEIHHSYWMRQANIHQNPGQIWNRTECTRWAKENNLEYMVGEGVYLFKADEKLKPEDRNR